MLRLLDLTVQDNLAASRKKWDNSANHSRTSSGTGYYSATSSDLQHPSNPASPDHKIELPGYNTPVESRSRISITSPTSNKSNTSQNHINRPTFRYPKKKNSSLTSLSSGVKSDASEFSSMIYQPKAARLRWMTLKNKSVITNRTPKIKDMAENEAWQAILRENCVRGNLGLGAYIRVNTLCAGDVFVSVPL